MMRRFGTIILGLLLFGLIGPQPVWAHATLLRADPAPNAVIAEPPAEIRLWFSELLEPAFSYIRLSDSDGNPVATPASEIDRNNAYQMALRPGDLPEGLYTVNWLALSA